MCPSTNFCFQADFLSVLTMQENYWLYNFDVTSIGGMFGLGYGCETCNTLWQNVDSPQFGVFLGTESDLSWYYQS